MGRRKITKSVWDDSDRWIKIFKEGESSCGWCFYYECWKDWQVCTPWARKNIKKYVLCPQIQYKKCKFRKLVEEVKKKENFNQFCEKNGWNIY